MFQPKAQNPMLAALLIIAATAFIASATLLAKVLGTDTLGPRLHPFQISHGRFVFALIAFSSVALIARPEISRPHWGLHIGRTVFGWMGVTLMFASVAIIPMGDATAISFLNPVFAMMLAIPLLIVGATRGAISLIDLWTGHDKAVLEGPRLHVYECFGCHFVGMKNCLGWKQL